MHEKLGDMDLNVCNQVVTSNQRKLKEPYEIEGAVCDLPTTNYHTQSGPILVNQSYLKVSKSRKQFLELLILPKNERKTTKIILRTLEIFFPHFRSFFGRIENSKNCFQDLLTFRRKNPKTLFFESTECTKQLKSIKSVD